MEQLKFPIGFLWGSSTSSYQVEGGIENCDWSKVYPAGRACDYYNLYEEDFNWLKKLNQNAYRFSLEWSRIEPEEGKFDQKEIEHYRKIIFSLKNKGIEPFITLWHWTMPLWLAEKGGWESKEIVNYFSRYTEKIISSFKNEVKFWITINEPEIYVSHSYLKGDWPPQKKSIFKFLKVLSNFERAHQAAYEIIHKFSPKAQVGIAQNVAYYEGGFMASLVDWFCNQRFLNQIKNYQDFIGLNYYFHNRVKGFKFNQNENKKVSDIGWEIYPEGIYFVLKNLKKYQKPIYITENGLADAKDKLRQDFIKEHLYWIYKAIQEGLGVRGYFHWSLTDNFEWAKGFGPRFGLIEIDYKTLKRKPRPSAYFYARVCKENTLTLN